MKVLIVYPPLNYPVYPYPATYILAGLLKSENLNVDVLDLNVEFLKYILSTSNLKRVKKKIICIYNGKLISDEHKKYIEKFLFKYKEITDIVINEVDKYYKLFINPSTSPKIRRRINYALKLAFVPYYPSIINPQMIFLSETNYKYSFNYTDLLNRTSNNEDNPYLDFFKYIIKSRKIMNYDLVAITIPFDINLYPALTFSKTLKEKTDCNVVIGGVLINSTVNAYVNYPSLFDNYFDAILVGEAEKSLINYIEYLHNKIPISLVSGAVYKEKNIVRINDISLGCSKNEMKFPSFKNINFSDYLFKRINIEFSKGCYWGKCVYCSSSIKKYSVIDVEDAVNELEEIIKETGITIFSVLDDAVSVNFAEKFADEIIKRKINIEYHMYLRFEKEYNKLLFDKLYASGLKSIFWGLESASQRLLDIMNKGIDVSIVPEILRLSHETGIQNIVSFIFGFPYELKEDILKTINFQKENKTYIDCINNFRFTLLKGSALLNQKENFQITKIKDIEEFSNYLSYESLGVSKDELNGILEDNNIILPPIFTRW